VKEKREDNRGGARFRGQTEFGDVGREYYKLRRQKNNKKVEYTGEQFLAASPLRARKAIEMIALGYGDEEIARKLGATHHTIKALRFRCVEDIAKRKQELLQIVMPGAALSAEKAIELLKNETRARDAAVVHGIFTDSIGKLTGGVTQKIEVTGSIDIHAKYDELVKKIEERAKARVIDVPAVPVLDNGTDPDRQ
jgi:hypothetical protein